MVAQEAHMLQADKYKTQSCCTLVIDSSVHMRQRLGEIMIIWSPYLDLKYTPPRSDHRVRL